MVVVAAPAAITLSGPMRRLPLLLALLAALALAGCGQASSESSADKFKGDQKAVAEVVENLQDAGERKDAERICNDILAPSLVAQVKAAGSDCAAQMKASLDDADEYELQVESVTVQGNRAQAEVTGKGSETATMALVKERGGWRIADLGAPA
jgi:outer membrane lipoprotein-sorting protein